MTFCCAQLQNLFFNLSVEHIDDGRPLRSQLIFDQNCDYRDMVGAVDEVNHWGSDMAPGRRRRRRK